jgi:hypothetical protein
VIFFTHDIALRPSPYGCTPALLARAVDGAQARGIACVTVDDALRRIGSN